MAQHAPVQALQAAPPRLGLIASAVNMVARPGGPGGRWQGGLSFLPENCAGGEVLDPCAGTTKTIGDNVDIVTFDPVILAVGQTCSAIDDVLRGEMPARVERLLLATSSKLLAGELWKGTRAKASGFDNKYLASNDANTVTDGSVAEVNALACLEDALAACTAQRGMIHCTQGTLTRWKAAQVVERNGNLWLSPNDHIVVADAGYDGSGPDGQAAADGSVWAYATDLVGVWLDPPRALPAEEVGAVDRSVNNIAYRSERRAAATWGGCCHLAAEIDLEICADLGAS